MFRFSVPELLAGNTVVVKHASICFESGNTIEKILTEAGFPKGVFLNLEVGYKKFKVIIENPVIQGGG